MRENWKSSQGLNPNAVVYIASQDQEPPHSTQKKAEPSGLSAYSASFRPEKLHKIWHHKHNNNKIMHQLPLNTNYQQQQQHHVNNMNTFNKYQQPTNHYVNHQHQTTGGSHDSYLDHSRTTIVDILSENHHREINIFDAFSPNFEIKRLTNIEIDKHRKFLMNLNNEVQESLNCNKTNEEAQIMNIWSSNLEEGISAIEDIIEDYPFVAIDTEFPGVISRPADDTFHYWAGDSSYDGYGYQLVCDNVNKMKLIQLGLTFYNEAGETPSTHCTFQFNFHFDIGHDLFAPESISLLINSGIDFDKLSKCGINQKRFASLITMSGLVLNEDIRWICFHGSYDFAYLIKTLSVKHLPNEEAHFFFYLSKYFPIIYDLKVLLRSLDVPDMIKAAGLQKIANSLNVQRIGTSHMAGSDSLLTGNIFFKLRQEFECDKESTFIKEINNLNNTLYGLADQQLLQC